MMSWALKRAALPAMPGFASFYRAINDREPFPWQNRLASEVARTGEWPAEIGVPTGLGKTACLDIAIWWLASQAHLVPADRAAPTRIWWVVNRRLLVDSTFEHAKRMSRRLREAADDSELDCIVGSVGIRLRSLSARQANPLEIIRLRGGVSPGRPTDPSQPAVILSTVPMYGSRLLFRGYGYGRTSSLRPVDAALAGTDSLVLLDEAHLAQHLPGLLRSLAECAPARVSLPVACRASPRLVSLTATGEASGAARFDLNEDDRTHHVVRQRLGAAKPMRVGHAAGGAGNALAKTTLELIRNAPQPATFIVFANQPKTAREVFDRLQRKVPDVLLLTGRTREFEAESIRARVLDGTTGMAATRDSTIERERHLVVVATQTLEVGADVDAEYLVTEACGVRALTQRLGRLNRLGRFQHAQAVYVHTKPTVKAKGKEPARWPVYGAEPAVVLQRLEERLVQGEGTIDVSPREVAAVLGSPREDGGRAPEILYGLLWEWLKTTTPPVGEAPVEPYFSGITERDLAVSIVWRVHVPEQGHRLWPPSRDREAVDVPISEVREVLADESIARLVAGGDGVTVENCAAADLRPGDQLVLSTDRLLDEFGWAPKSQLPVFDMSLEDHGLALDASALGRLCGVTLSDRVWTALREPDVVDDVDDADRARATQALLDALLAAEPPAGWDRLKWSEFVDRLEPNVEFGAANEVARLVVREDRRAWEEATEEDELSFADQAVYLDRHCEAVGNEAERTAIQLGIPSRLVETLKLAGQLHDCGKREPRFQKWLNPRGKANDRLLAKSQYPRRFSRRYRNEAGWPGGGRHEALSARLVEAWLDRKGHVDCRLCRELLLHLVISHHGEGRPLVVPRPDETAVEVDLAFEGRRVSVPAALSEVDWNQPFRFRQLNGEYGPWGLALLEAILRQADHVVSAAKEVSGFKEDA